MSFFLILLIKLKEFKKKQNPKKEWQRFFYAKLYNTHLIYISTRRFKIFLLNLKERKKAKGLFWRTYVQKWHVYGSSVCVEGVWGGVIV